MAGRDQRGNGNPRPRPDAGRGGSPSPASPAPERSAPGVKKFGADGRYQIVSQLGKGGFGTVYKAYDHRLAKYVAIKVINVSDIPPEDLADYLRYFDDEAKTAAQLEHPGVVTVLDYDPNAQEPFIVMPLVECGTLRDWLMQHPRMPWPQVLDLAVQVTDALYYAHTHGVRAHRDIKPANIFCAVDGRYRIGDFGIARRHRLTTGATRSAFLGAGTPRYMAPEQIIAPRTVDARSDIFAICVVLYEVLTGKLPFRGVTLDFDPEEDPGSAQRIVDVAFVAPVPIQRLAPDVPAELARIVERGLSKDPYQRFGNCRELRDALLAIDMRKGGKRPHQAGRWIGRAAAVVALGAVAAGAYRFHEDIAELVLDRWAAYQTRSVTSVAEARAGAEAAQAGTYAAALWQKAEDATREAETLEKAGKYRRAENLRREALALYGQAATQAWRYRGEDLSRQVSEAREKAASLSTRDHPAAARAFEQGDRARARGEDLMRENPRLAVPSLEEALNSYRDALAGSEEVMIRAGVERLSTAKLSLAKVAMLSDPPADLRAGAEALQNQLAAIQKSIESGELLDSRSELSRAESTLRDLALETALEVRRRTERVRSDALARGRLTGEAEQRMASADRSFNKAIDRMSQAKNTEDLLAVIDLLNDAQPVYGQVGASALGSALAAADAARAEAEAAGASTAGSARDKYQRGLKLLGDARKRSQGELNRGLDEARKASAEFAEAATLAHAEAQNVAIKVPIKRAEALRAREQAELAGAASRDRASQSYQGALSAMEKGDSISETDAAGQAARISAYEEAIRAFGEAEKLARAPVPPTPVPEKPRAVEPAEPVEPFAVKQQPPAGAVVTLATGAPQQFWAKTTVGGVNYHWAFDGEPMPEADGNAGLELEPSANYSKGLHRLSVTVVDRAGRRVVREWTVRIGDDGE